MWFGIFKEMYLRNRSAFFWIIIFPTVMYLVFSSIFSGVGKEIKLDIGIFGESRYFNEVLKHLNMDVKVHRFERVEDLKRAVEEAKIDVGVVLKDFDRDLMVSVITGGKRKARVEVFYRSGDYVSSVGAEIMKGIFENADIEMMKVLGKLKGIKIVYENRRENETDPYVPVGMTLAMLGAGILGVSFGNSRLEERGIFKLMRTTPVGNFGIEIMSVHIAALLISIFLVLGIALSLGRVSKIDWLDLLVYVPFGAATFASIGTMCSAMGELFTNIVYFAMMFTGGLFFQTSGFMYGITYLNPAYHVNEMLLKSFGMDARFNFTVPLVWLVSSLAIYAALRRGKVE